MVPPLPTEKTTAVNRQSILFTGCRIVDADTDIACGWILVTGDIVEAVGRGTPDPAIVTQAAQVQDATGLVVMPGVIDTHVHFREPGLTHKATIASESRAAAAGGVTTYFDMPNTIPATTTPGAWDDKMSRAAATSLVNYAFFVGATPDNIGWLSSLDYTDRPGVKLFMGSTTGATADTSGDWLDSLFSRVGALIAVHAEDDSIIADARDAAVAQYGGSPDNVPVAMHPAIRTREACIASTRLITSIARRHNHRLHVCHISTADELHFFEPDTDPSGKLLTAETCPQYVTFDSADYDRLGARVKCNPSIKDLSDREALEAALATGRIDTIATDHAPHMLSDKTGGALTAASGMPGVQFSLPVMLEKTLDGRLTLQSVSRLMSANPATIFGVERRGYLRPGYHADLVFLRAGAPHTIADADVISTCGWTPYTGITLTYAVQSTWVNGTCVYADGEFPALLHPAATPVKFKGL